MPLATAMLGEGFSFVQAMVLTQQVYEDLKETFKMAKAVANETGKKLA